MSMWPDLKMFGRQVRVMRKGEGISQASLASEIGITRTYLSQIENGEALGLSYRLARALAVRLKINPMLYVSDRQTTKPPLMTPELRRTIGRLRG